MRTIAPAQARLAARGAYRAAVDSALRLVPIAIPVVAGAVAFRAPEAILERTIAAILAVGFVVMVQRWPERALLALIAFLPFQLTVFSLAYRFGVPGGVLRPLGGYRDGIVIGLALVALRRARTDGWHIDNVDRFAIAFIGINLLYFAFPELLVRPADDFFAGPTTDFAVRALALRVNATPILMLLAVRHLRPTPQFRAALIRVVLVVGVAAAAVSIYEFAFSDSWNGFAVRSVQFHIFQQEVLDLPPPQGDIRSFVHVGGREFTRPGGLLFDPLPNAFYLLIPLAAGIQVLQRRAAALAAPALAVIAVAILLTYVRSAILAVGIVVLVALRHAGQRRVQFTIAVAACLLFVLMTAAGTGYVPRFGDPGSDELHKSGLEQGIEVLTTHPMGLGLGSAPGIGSQFQTKSLTAESAYLQVGNELGVIAMVVFVGLLATVLRRLLTARTDPDGSIGWAAAAGAGLAIVGLFLHVWIAITVALTFWALAGTALASRDELDRDAPREPEASALRY